MTHKLTPQVLEAVEQSRTSGETVVINLGLLVDDTADAKTYCDEVDRLEVLDKELPEAVSQFACDHTQLIINSITCYTGESWEVVLVWQAPLVVREPPRKYEDKDDPDGMPF